MLQVRDLFVAKSVARCLSQLPYCFGARALACSTFLIISLPECLKIQLQSAENKTTICKLFRVANPNFFRIIMLMQCFYHLGEYPALKGMLHSNLYQNFLQVSTEISNCFGFRDLIDSSICSTLGRLASFSGMSCCDSYTPANTALAETVRPLKPKVLITCTPKIGHCTLSKLFSVTRQIHHDETLSPLQNQRKVTWHFSPRNNSLVGASTPIQ